MSDNDTFRAREKALEDLFFDKQNRELIERHREERKHLEERAALEQATGIEDEQVLDDMLSINVTAESLSALRLYPMVVVAWADKSMDERERRAILRAAHKSGIDEGSAAAELLTSWMLHQPGEEVHTAWCEFIESLRGALSPEAFETLRKQIFLQVRDVSEAAGGFLGLASISAAEEVAISDLEKVFEGG